MVVSKDDLKKYLKYEKKKYFSSKKNYIKSMLFRNASEKYIIWKYQKRLRKYEYHLNNNHKFRKIIYKYLNQKIGNKYGLHISPNTFDIGLKIMHLGSILVNGTARIGKNCSIHVNTAIAAHGIKDTSPIIGDNCIIGVGATLIGEISIGDNCAIGAGSVVNKSFSDNVTIAGVPARIISNNTSKTWRKE